MPQKSPDSLFVKIVKPGPVNVTKVTEKLIPMEKFDGVFQLRVSGPYILMPDYG